jgi:hypothetical protein
VKKLPKDVKAYSDRFKAALVGGPEALVKFLAADNLRLSGLLVDAVGEVADARGQLGRARRDAELYQQLAAAADKGTGGVTVLVRLADEPPQVVVCAGTRDAEDRIGEILARTLKGTFDVKLDRVDEGKGAGA